MVPAKLKPGDHVRVIAPSHSFSSSFTKEYRKRAEERLGSLGLSVSYGKHVDELNDFDTTTIENRLEDLHEAFADPDVQAIIPARGGSSVTQLLKYIDYSLIKNNPKILCGLSDITALSYALYAKTGIINYYGPHYTMLGASEISDFSIQSIKETLFSADPVNIPVSEYYCESAWDKRIILNQGFWTINKGEAEGKSIGGNFLTTNFMLGSEYMPDISDCILFLEENHILDYKDIQNELQSILNHHYKNPKALLIGRFQKESDMTRELLTDIVKSKKELEGVPVVGNVDFGHTAPMLTLPIGGAIKVVVKAGDDVQILITQH